MLTRWSEHLDPKHVLCEYPRPQLVRDSYLNLNGIWDMHIGIEQDEPVLFSQQILVPFSPESELGGSHAPLSPSQTLWYRRSVSLENGFHPLGNRLLLHFGAVDHACWVYVDGQLLMHHEGGYLPFTVDVTDSFSDIRQPHVLTVKVQDPTDTAPQCRGKQKLSHGGIWYTPQSGIWQTVWMESVPEHWIIAADLTPDVENSSFSVKVFSDEDVPLTINFEGSTIMAMTNTTVVVQVPNAHLWSPEDPHLYQIVLSTPNDTVTSYIAMRSVCVSKDEHDTPRLMLNGKPYFHHGVLDQGYWSDGLYTPPSDEAMIWDIQTMKDLGFNMLRKHIKVEPLRWYHHCDVLGMLVWQDMVNGGGSYKLSTISTPLITGWHFDDHSYRKFARTDEVGRRIFLDELQQMVRHLYNCPCIVMWVPFNEGWGQFDANQAVQLIRNIDKTRTIDHASGWHDQGIGDFKSLHVYFRPYSFKQDAKGRCVILTEFGGYSYAVPGHVAQDKTFGYKKLKSAEALTEAIRRLYEQQIVPAVAKGLSADVYTQLSDVEEEINGLVTYDRAVVKVPRQVMLDISRQLGY